MKLTAEPARASHAMKAISADEQRGAGRQRAESAPDRHRPGPPSDEPISSEIADVTVIDVCRELQKSQKTSPPKRHA